MNFFRRLFAKAKDDQSMGFIKYTSDGFSEVNGEDYKSQSDVMGDYKADYTEIDGFLVYKRCVALATHYFYEKGFGVTEVDQDYTNFPQLRLRKEGQNDILVYIEFTWENKSFDDVFDKETITKERKEDIEMNCDTLLLKFNFVDDADATFYEDKHYPYTLEELYVF